MAGNFKANRIWRVTAKADARTPEHLFVAGTPVNAVTGRIVLLPADQAFRALVLNRMTSRAYRWQPSDCVLRASSGMQCAAQNRHCVIHGMSPLSDKVVEAHEAMLTPG